MKRNRPARSLWLLPALLLTACEEEPVTPPPTEKQLPSAEVEVLIDGRGVPHIYAQNDEDLFFVYGYQLASDRMLQLEMFRRYAHGQLSEVLGADGPGTVRGDSLTDDTFAKVFNWRYWGKVDADWMKQNDPEQYALTSAWAAGINKRVDEIEQGKVPTPYGFQTDQLDFKPGKWTPEDVYIVQKMVNFGLDQTILYEVLITFIDAFNPDALKAIELFRPARQVFTLPEEDRPATSMAANLRTPFIGPPNLGGREALFAPGSLATLGRLNHTKALGSNNWAVDGRHTENGMPIVAGDPHLGFAFSGMMYALHLNSMDAGGSYDNVGFAFVAVPGLFAGHNREFAYTPTSAFSDVMDLWEVEIEDGMAKVGDELVAVEERSETIEVKDGSPVTFKVIDVPGYGVILDHKLIGSPVPFVDGGKYAMVGWTGYKQRPARYFRPLMKAKTLDEFESAVDQMPEMSYNFVGADKTGISYRVGVEVPARNQPAPGREPWKVMDASDPQSIWPAGKFLTPEQKPHSRALERGWIATANNDPFGFTGDGRVDNDPWYYGAVFPPGWRAARIESELTRLAERGGITPEEMQTLQMDVHSGLADDILPVVSEAFAAVQTDPDLAEFNNRPELAQLVQLLAVDWDRRMARSSSGALAFHAFAHFVTSNIIEDDLNTIIFNQVLEAAPMYMLKVAALALNGVYPNGDQVMLEGRNRLVLKSLSDTAAFLNERFGGVDPANYTFADMRVSSMDHAFGRDFDLAEVPTDGGEDTVNVAQSEFRNAAGETAEQWVSHWGPIERQVMHFNDAGVPESYANFPMGNVADPDGKHFEDELPGWLDGDYKKLLFERAEIEAAAESSYTIPAAK